MTDQEKNQIILDLINELSQVRKTQACLKAQLQKANRRLADFSRKFSDYIRHNNPSLGNVDSYPSYEEVMGWEQSHREAVQREEEIRHLLQKAGVAL